MAFNCIASLLIIAGDLQNAFSGKGRQAQARAVSQWLLSLEKPTVVCSGNHDYWSSNPLFPLDEKAEGGWIKDLLGRGSIVGVDGDTVTLGGLKLYVNGWLQKPPAGPFDIVVTHAPPSHSPCAQSDGWDNGDPEIWEALQPPPALLLCGHVHWPAKLYCKWPPAFPTCTILVSGCTCGLRHRLIGQSTPIGALPFTACRHASKRE